MKALPSFRVTRDRRTKAALKRCAVASRAALNDADKTLADVEHQASCFIGAIQSAAESREQDGSALQQARASLVQRSAALSLHLQTGIGQLRTALLRKRSRAGRFTVVLFGRTTAGKSTIREAITGGDGSTIGKGGQRMTRDIREYPWNGLTILDTPGFGAYEGDEDRQHAISVVDESDVIVFLLSSDGIQEEAFREMAVLNRLRKQVVFVLNVKHDLTKVSKYRRDFLRDPEAFLGTEDVQSHRNRIGSLAQDHAPWMAQKVRLVVLHAQAAHLARLTEYESEAKRLLAGSNIGELLHLLEAELQDHGPERRIQTIIGGTERALAFTAEHLVTISEDFHEEAALLQEKHLELTKALDDFVGRFPGRCHDAVAAHFSSVLRGLGAFVDDNLRKKDFKERWQSRMAELRTEEWSKQFATEIAEEVSAKVGEFSRQLRQDSEFLHRQDAEGADYADPTDWRKVVRRVGYGIGIAVLAIGFFASPPGWVTAAVGAAGAAIAILSGFIPHVDEERKKAKEQARRQLAEEVASLSGKVETSLGDWFSKEVEQGLLVPLHADVKALHESIDGLSSAAAELSNGFQATRRNLIGSYPSHFRPEPKS